MTELFIHIRFTSPVFDYIQVWLTDEKGTRPATLGGKEQSFTEYYKIEAHKFGIGLIAGVEFFTQLREKREQRGG